MEKLIVIFDNKANGTETDIEIPLHITADEFIKALNCAMQLNIDVQNKEKCFLRSENPIGLIRGDKLMKDFNLHTGSKICFERR